jgi:hypothetical protein
MIPNQKAIAALNQSSNASTLYHNRLPQATLEMKSCQLEQSGSATLSKQFPRCPWMGFLLASFG